MKNINIDTAYFALVLIIVSSGGFYQSYNLYHSPDGSGSIGGLFFLVASLFILLIALMVLAKRK